jgi:hypothetical protein
MKLTLGVVLTLVLLSQPAVADDVLGTKVDTKAFFLARRGEYKISLANGVTPAEEDEKAEVAPGTKPEVEMVTLPICWPDGCDPGWIYFEYANTQVFENRISPTESVFTLFLTVKQKVKKYTWHESGLAVTFKNHQYTTMNGETITLEHVFSKSGD